MRIPEKPVVGIELNDLASFDNIVLVFEVYFYTEGTTVPKCSGTPGQI